MVNKYNSSKRSIIIRSREEEDKRAEENVNFVYIVWFGEFLLYI